jgi:hypothetical protein
MSSLFSLKQWCPEASGSLFVCVSLFSSNIHFDAIGCHGDLSISKSWIVLNQVKLLVILVRLHQLSELLHATGVSVERVNDME